MSFERESSFPGLVLAKTQEDLLCLSLLDIQLDGKVLFLPDTDAPALAGPFKDGSCNILGPTCVYGLTNGELFGMHGYYAEKRFADCQVEVEPILHVWKIRHGDFEHKMLDKTEQYKNWHCSTSI